MGVGGLRGKHLPSHGWARPQPVERGRPCPVGVCRLPPSVWSRDDPGPCEAEEAGVVEVKVRVPPGAGLLLPASWLLGGASPYGADAQARVSGTRSDYRRRRGAHPDFPPSVSRGPSAPGGAEEAGGLGARPVSGWAFWGSFIHPFRQEVMWRRWPGPLRWSACSSGDTGPPIRPPPRGVFIPLCGGSHLW